MWLMVPFAMAVSSAPGSIDPLSRRRSGCLGIDIEAREERLRSGDAALPGGMRSPPQLVEDGRSAVAIGAIRVRVPELGEEAWRGPRQERRGSEADEPARLDEVAQDALQPLGGRVIPVLRGLCQDPRLFGVDHLVRATDVRPQLRQSVVQPAGRNVVAVDAQGLVPDV